MHVERASFRCLAIAAVVTLGLIGAAHRAPATTQPAATQPADPQLRERRELEHRIEARIEALEPVEICYTNAQRRQLELEVDQLKARVRAQKPRVEILKQRVLTDSDQL